MSYYIASVLQCESSYGNKKVFPFAISSTLSLYVASVGQRLALKEKKKEKNKIRISVGKRLEQNIQCLILTNSRAHYISGKIWYSRLRRK